LTCESDSCFPFSRLVWLRANGQPMVAWSNGTTPGPHSGVVTKSSLQIKVTSDLHGQVFTCQASNGIGPQIQDIIPIKVLCKFLMSYQFYNSIQQHILISILLLFRQAAVFASRIYGGHCRRQTGHY